MYISCVCVFRQLPKIYVWAVMKKRKLTWYGLSYKMQDGCHSKNIHDGYSWDNEYVTECIVNFLHNGANGVTVETKETYTTTVEERKEVQNWQVWPTAKSARVLCHERAIHDPNVLARIYELLRPLHYTEIILGQAQPKKTLTSGYITCSILYK